MNSRMVRLMLAGATVVLAATTGCQTWTAGMTLPSGRYLEHPPQYFPPSPSFPLSKELATMEKQQAAPAGVPVAPGLPDGVVPGGGMVLPPPGP